MKTMKKLYGRHIENVCSVVGINFTVASEKRKRQISESKRHFNRKMDTCHKLAKKV